MTLYLLQRVQYNSHKDEQGGAAEELGELLLYPEKACKSGHDGDEGNEQGTGQSDARHDGVNIVCSGFARLYSRNEAVVALHVLGHLHGVEGDSCLEIGECHNQNNEYGIIQDTRMIQELIQHPAASIAGNGLG